MVCCVCCKVAGFGLDGLLQGGRLRIVDRSPESTYSWPGMFGTVLLAIATVLHVYVLARAWTVPRIRRKVSRRGYFGVGGLLWVGFVGGRVFGHDAAGLPAMVLELAALSYIATVFLTACCLLVVDGVTLGGLLLRRAVPALRGGALAAGALLGGLALVQGLRPPVVVQHEVALPGLPAALDGTVLVAVSDTHLGSQRGARWLEARVEQLLAERPDLIVLIGDVFERHGAGARGEAGELLPTLRRLQAPLGVLAVPGNHDMHRHAPGSPEVLAPLVRAGHRVLRNEWVEVRPGLIVAGVDDLTRLSRSDDPGAAPAALARALAGRPAGAATLLLSHTPWRAEEAAAAGVGLMLSGHTHGGQIWPLGYLVQLRYPLLAGRYDVSGATVIVSRGAGTWGPRMRLWQPGEILRITLRTEGKPDR